MVKTTVAGVITKEIDGEKHILLTKRSIEPYKDFWCLPGGHIDANETAENAIDREIEEETGLSFDGSFFLYFDEIIPEKNIHAVVLVFQGSGNGKTKIREEVSDISWFNLSEINELQLAFQHNLIVSSVVNANIKL